jgi:hypothetical protein
MRNKKGFDLEISDGEGRPAVKTFPADNLLKTGCFVPSPLIHVNGNPTLRGKRKNTSNVISVPMGY